MAMKAITVTPGTRKIDLAESDEPVLKTAEDVKLQVLRVGICGTERRNDSGH
jgi:threonine dehydrogenase-like Zn-dependent dehydrogenase